MLLTHYTTLSTRKLNWVPLTTSSVVTNTHLQRADFFLSKSLKPMLKSLLPLFFFCVCAGPNATKIYVINWENTKFSIYHFRYNKITVTALVPAYNEFGYNEYPATTSRFLYINITDTTVEKFGYNEHLLITSSFFCVCLLAVSDPMI